MILFVENKREETRKFFLESFLRASTLVIFYMVLCEFFFFNLSFKILIFLYSKKNSSFQIFFSTILNLNVNQVTFWKISNLSEGRSMCKLFYFLENCNLTSILDKFNIYTLFFNHACNFYFPNLCLSNSYFN